MAKITLVTAAPEKKRQFDVSSLHLTTHELAQMRVANILPTEQGDVFDINMSEISQTAPTVVKTFGAFKLKTYAFFVPTRVVWKHYQDWRIDTADTTVGRSPIYWSLHVLFQYMFGLMKYQNGSNTSIIINKNHLTNPNSFSMLTKSDYDANGFSTEYAKLEYYENANSEHPDTYDFYFVTGLTGSASTDPQGYLGFNLTTRGRMIMNMLRGLGYEIPTHIRWNVHNGSSVSTNEAASPIWLQTFDAIPILALCRIFYDYIYPSQYVQQQGFGELFGLGSSRLVNDISLYMSKILNIFYIAYEQDFFTSLWLYPNSVAAGTNASSFGPQSMSDTNTIQLQSTEYTTRLQQSSDSQTETLSAKALKWLEAVSDYAIRNNIGGTRFHEFMKSHFGWVSNESDSDRSQFLKSWQDTILFNPVIAQTGTDSQLLGEMAAVGSSRGGARLKFEAKETGFLIFCSLLVPEIAYYQGVKPWCLRQGRFDYYTPELDSVDLEPVQKMELYNSYDRLEANAIVPQNSLDDAFGFAYRYMKKYKVRHDYMSGDFRFNSRNRNMASYHTFRDVLYNRSNLALDARFMHSDNQCNRVFAFIGDSSHDHVETLFIFDVKKWSNMLSVGESIPLFNKMGQKTEVEYQGTQLN